MLLARIEPDGSVSNVVIGPAGHSDGGVEWAMSRLGGTWVLGSTDGSVRDAPVGVGSRWCEEHDSFACLRGCDHGDFLRRQRTRNPDEWTWFMGREFACDPGLHVPLQFDDMEPAIEAIVAFDPASVLDVGSGIGTLGITIGAEVGCPVTLVEPVERLSGLSARNAAMHDVDAHCIVGDIHDVEGKFDAIIADVPSIESDVAQILEHPYAADGGPDGLDILREVFAAARHLLNSGGVLVVRDVALPLVDGYRWSVVSDANGVIVVRSSS